MGSVLFTLRWLQDTNHALSQNLLNMGAITREHSQKQSYFRNQDKMNSIFDQQRADRRAGLSQTREWVRQGEVQKMNEDFKAATEKYDAVQKKSDATAAEKTQADTEMNAANTAMQTARETIAREDQNFQIGLAALEEGDNRLKSAAQAIRDKEAADYDEDYTNRKTTLETERTELTEQKKAIQGELAQAAPECTVNFGLKGQ